MEGNVRAGDGKTYEPRCELHAVKLEKWECPVLWHIATGHDLFWAELGENGPVVWTRDEVPGA